MKKIDVGSELIKGMKNAIEHARGKKPARARSKPKSQKVDVSLWLDADVVAFFKADGPGWQTRMNEVLAKAAKRRRRVV